MPRYIDAEILSKQLEHEKGLMERGNTFNQTLIAYTIGEIKNEVDRFPTVDVAPVVHGHWIDTGKRHISVISCSCCNHTIVGSYVERVNRNYLYCPKCGAKMDAEEDPKK